MLVWRVARPENRQLRVVFGVARPAFVWEGASSGLSADVFTLCLLRECGFALRSSSADVRSVASLREVATSE